MFNNKQEEQKKTNEEEQQRLKEIADIIEREEEEEEQLQGKKQKTTDDENEQCDKPQRNWSSISGYNLHPHMPAQNPLMCHALNINAEMGQRPPSAFGPTPHATYTGYVTPSRYGTYGGFTTYKRQPKVGEHVVSDMHAHSFMGMQRGMKEAAGVKNYNKTAPIQHEWHPGSISMTIQSVICMYKERMDRFAHQNMGNGDVNVQVALCLLQDQLKAMELVAAGLAFCKATDIRLVVMRALMVDHHDKEKTIRVAQILTEAGIPATNQQAQAGSNSLFGSYGGYNGMTKRTNSGNEKVKDLTCWNWNSKGSCRFGKACKFTHHLSKENGDNEENNK